MKHAKLSASGSHRWLTCPASVRASECYSDTSGRDAQWGTACHYVGEQMLLGFDVAIGSEAEGILVDSEMLETAETYADYCRSLIGKDSEVIVEGRMDFSNVVPEGFGTADCIVINGTALHVIDLKTGRNLVNAEDNSQLMLYAIGALNEFDFMHDIETVELHIVQSRAGHIDSWEVSPAQLEGWGEWVSQRAKLALSPDAPFCPESKACMWCPHKADCEALRNHVNDIVKGDFDELEDVDGNADKVSDINLKKVLDNADLIVGFVAACKEVALERMQSGVSIDGYKIVESKTNRKWRDEAEVEEHLKGKIKVGDLYQKKLIPMTQILKLRPKDKKLQAMLVKPEGKPTIAPMSDKRPAMTSVADEF